ncbi:conserved hypothetical protein [Uncinocarpus reesii 1704]|uniref:Protein PBN1 n=1 Tax=Uncinocarpus reesii (strain UAMH 1704) TaxID=336963 RepID=C4JNQ7_UNCRE|nr:uncharacterized protein UREG_04377 [Uncinocarpus reesii 1704]EEP79531.1 conserved hypothetical protein [Uncinocarpus reesii 1704]
MKRRVTFIHDAEGEFDPKRAHLTSDSLSIQLLDAARQERLTFGFQELPNEKAFGQDVNCTVPEISFTSSGDILKSGALPSLQFHQLLPSLEQFATYIREAICPKQDIICLNGAALIRSADTLDIDYDRVQNSFVVTAYWSKATGKDGWKDTIYHERSSEDKTDIGILATQQDLEPDEVRIGGFLAMVGRDEELNEYQLSTADSLFLESHNIRGLRHIAGEADLEAPDWIIQRWGSQLLVELATTNPEEINVDTKNHEDWKSTIPLHLRYLHPSSSGYRNISMPWPIVFWACTYQDQGKMGYNPFDRANLSWDDLFAPKTLFYQFHPSPEPRGEKLIETIQVPALKMNKDTDFIANQAIEFGTIAVVLLGFLWVSWKLGFVARSTGVQSNQNQTTRVAGSKKTQ